MAPKVSVVVPVYNPGRRIEPLIASLRRQSLPRDEWEAIFVDDGSTDGTSGRLDRLAAEEPGFEVVHIPNSGWPGRPRNVGMDAARGDYLYFVDNDDWLGDEALERLHATAVRTGADVVVGKVVGHGRTMSRELFRANIDDARLGRDRLLTLLTPHKLFRRAFVDEHGLRFPEGRRRLEDHHFVLRAYFLAERISVLADYACYHWVGREQGSTASTELLDPRDYYGRDLPEVLDVVERHTEPGPFRDRLLGHWYRSKMLSRLDKRFARYPRRVRRAVFEEIRRLAQARFDEEMDERLGPLQRIRARLLRAGRMDVIEALSVVEAGLRAEAWVESAAWEDGELVLHVRGSLRYPDGSPVTFTRDDDRTYLDLPPGTPETPALRPEDRDVTEAVGRSALRAFVRSRADGTEFRLPGRGGLAPRDEGEDATSAEVAGEVRLPPLGAAAGAALPRGAWEIHAEVASCGWSAGCPLAIEEDRLPEPALLGASVRALPYASSGALRLAWGAPPDHGSNGATGASVPRRLMRRVPPLLAAARVVRRTQRAVRARRGGRRRGASTRSAGTPATPRR